MAGWLAAKSDRFAALMPAIWVAPFVRIPRCSICNLLCRDPAECLKLCQPLQAVPGRAALVCQQDAQHPSQVGLLEPALSSPSQVALSLKPCAALPTRGLPIKCMFILHARPASSPCA
jgi:hypothetical protein